MIRAAVFALVLALVLALAGCSAARDAISLGKFAIGCSARPNDCN